MSLHDNVVSDSIYDSRLHNEPQHPLRAPEQHSISDLHNKHGSVPCDQFSCGPPTQHKRTYTTLSKEHTKLLREEEPLFLPEEYGAGFFPAIPGSTLKAGKYEIVTKLGWGKQSSTWLIKDLRCVSTWLERECLPKILNCAD